MKTIRLGKGLTLPLDAVTQTFVILAKRGVGKTYTAKLLTEQMLDARQRVCIIDPLGVWWGLRANEDGTPGGYPVVIVGGEHADIPLIASAGHVIAELASDSTAPSLVLDLSMLRKGEQKTFVTAFLESLYHRNREPLHLIVDEADRFAPQRAMHGEEVMLGAIEDVVRRGRSKGLGVTLISQRSAVLNKDVLSQAEVLVALRTVAPLDRAAIDEWVKYHGDQEKRAQLMADIATLPVGTAYVWSPGWLDLFVKVAIDKAKTFDSSATPKVGERPPPAKLRPVDLQALTHRMEATIAEADANNPAKLRARIVELQRVADRATAAAALAVREPEVRVEKVVERVPFIPPDAIDAIARARSMAAEFEAHLARIAELFDKPGHDTASIQSAIRALVPPAPSPVAQEPRRPVARANGHEPVVAARVPSDGEAPNLRAGERKMLNVLARSHPVRLSLPQLGTLAKFARKGGTFGAYMRTLKRAGYVEMGPDELLTITPEGMAIAGVEPGNPMTPEEIREQYRSVLRAGERAMFDALVARYPGGMSKEALGELTGYEASGGTFGAYIRTLRRNGLVRVETSGDIYATPTALGEL